MAKGASIKFKSYAETVPKLLELLKIQNELPKHKKIILKPHITAIEENSTPIFFAEEVLKFCLKHKSQEAKIFIAEGVDGYDTEELFDKYGYKKLAEKYDIALIDLNNSEVEEIEMPSFTRFSKIYYPKVLKDSFLISVPKLLEDEETIIVGALSSMLGVFPSSLYKGFFTKRKTKIRNWPIHYSIYDINQCKMPNLAVVDASEKGLILAGLPLEIEIQSAKLLGKKLEDIQYLKLFNEKTN